MSKILYRLRPHHIAHVLCYYVHWRKQNNPENISLTIPPFMLSEKKVGYSENNVNNVVRYMKNLLKSDGCIKIVPGIDDICLLGCNRKRKLCEEPDLAGLDILELQIGMTYPVSEIIKRLETMI